MPTVRPFRCFGSRPILVSLVVAALLIGLSWVRRGQPPRSISGVSIAITQAFLFAWFVLDLIRSVRKLDELEQRIHADALAVAGAVALVVIGGWGFLLNAGLPAIDWTLGIVPLLVLTWIFGVIRTSRKYR